LRDAWLSTQFLEKSFNAGADVRWLRHG
jgi:hypothetical protein